MDEKWLKNVMNTQVIKSSMYSAHMFIVIHQDCVPMTSQN